jgi:hypothetical protein
MLQAIICQNPEYFDEQTLQQDTFLKSQHLPQLAVFIPT